MKFTNHYAGLSVCAQAKYTLLSGKHTGHGFIRGNAQTDNGIGHLPLPPEEKSYVASVELVDNYVGRVEEKLKELHLLKNTLIIFTSDNGAVSVNVIYFSNGKLKGSKHDLYEGGIRVPFIAKWDEVIKPNTISNHVLAFLDYLPTLLDIARVNNYPTTDGNSFFSFNEW